jgi:hypothetical protein
MDPMDAAGTEAKAPAAAEHLLLGLFLLLCLAGPWSYVLYLWRTAHHLGFPLDDAWIHLTLARNLARYHTLAYWPGGPALSASTAPLYTFLLVPFFLVLRNEYVLSYILGSLMHLAGGVAFFRILRRLFPEARWARLLGLCGYALSWHLIYAAASGMETSGFIALLLFALDAHLESRTAPTWRLGLLLGLAVWVRPEAAIFAGVLLIDVVLARLLPGEGHGAAANTGHLGLPWKAMLLFAALGGSYLAFNYTLSGHPLPTTFYAKAALFCGPGERPRFIAASYTYFTDSEVVWLFYPALFGAGAVLCALARGRADRLLPGLLWIGALWLAYTINIPLLFREGRYLTPTLPFLLLLAVEGLGTLVERREAPARGGLIVGALLSLISLGGLLVPALRPQWAGLPVLVLVAALFAWHKLDRRSPRLRQIAVLLVVAAALAYHAAGRARFFAALCDYHARRHVLVAVELCSRTTSEAVIAAHDVGALGYYCPRRLVDFGGLVTPEAIPLLRRHDSAALAELILDQADYAVFLDSWFPAVRAKVAARAELVFSTQALNEGEGETLLVYRIRRPAGA